MLDKIKNTVFEVLDKKAEKLKDELKAVQNYKKEVNRTIAIEKAKIANTLIDKLVEEEEIEVPLEIRGIIIKRVFNEYNDFSLIELNNKMKLVWN